MALDISHHAPAVCGPTADSMRIASVGAVRSVSCLTRTVYAAGLTVDRYLAQCAGLPERPEPSGLLVWARRSTVRGGYPDGPAGDEGAEQGEVCGDADHEGW